LNFLSPLFLWGLIAISLPVIIHFYSRFKATNVEFSTVQFIKKLKATSIRRLQIKQLLLMLLRVLIITAIVLMFSQPFTNGYIPGWVPQNHSRTLNLIIDNSATMNAEINGKTLLEESKDISISLLPIFSKNTKISITQTCPSKVLYSGNSNNPIIPNIIRSIQNTYKFDDIYRVIDSCINGDSKNLDIKECIVFSDFYYKPDSSFFDQKFNKDNWKFYFIHPEKVLNNLSVFSSKSINKIKSLDELVNINVRILNNGIEKKDNIPIELIFDEHRVGQVVANFESDDMKDFIFKAYPGRQGIVEAKLILPNDDYSADNHSFIAMPVMEKIKCALVAGTQEELEILKIILYAIDPSNQFLFVETRLQPNINRLFLDEMDVVIIHNPISISDDAVLSLNNFLSDGGGLIWFQGDSMDTNANNRLSNKLGFPKIKSLISSGNKSGFFDVGYDDSQSALLSELKLKKIHSELPKIFSYLKTNLSNKHNIHISTKTGDAILMEFQSGSGKVFYFSTILDLKWNDLPVKGILVPMLYKMLMLSGTDEINTAEVNIGDLKTISVDQNLIRSKWEVISPSGEKQMIVPDFNREIISIINTDELGIYKLLSDGEIFTSFPTKIHEKEQLGSIVSQKIISDLIPSNNIRWIPMNMKEFSKYFHEVRHGKALWKVFLIICIILIFVESIVGRPINKNMKP